ncbi:hypothetical protein [Calderihabitans maritimus]|uniref:Uncharacterized protein n=1 Tax=Calderihabitans maritimus TaxID=1246530 RepID=A0A1Z5HRY2_9FIRM|nr:hypothetical protein [Calderihabitans maritimus]GAW92081.1 hypothetical protein MTY_2209 [Calderihabitans maritimus]
MVEKRNETEPNQERRTRVRLEDINKIRGKVEWVDPEKGPENRKRK